MNSDKKMMAQSNPYDVWNHVNKSRSIKRPTSLDYINSIFSDFIELHGDRNFGDDKSIVGGIALLDDIPVTVIGQQKFKRPIVCFVDTPGAACGIGAEERGQGHAIAQNLFTLSNLRTPIISIVIGEGGSGGALALTIADEIWMMEYSIYSILSPEGFASILWKDSTKAKTPAELMKLTSYDLLEQKIIDKIIPEESDIENNSDKVMKYLHVSLLQTVKNLKDTPIKTILKKRYSKYRNIGK